MSIWDLVKAWGGLVLVKVVKPMCINLAVLSELVLKVTLSDHLASWRSLWNWIKEIFCWFFAVWGGSVVPWIRRSLYLRFLCKTREYISLNWLWLAQRIHSTYYFVVLILLWCWPTTTTIKAWKEVEHILIRHILLLLLLLSSSQAILAFMDPETLLKCFHVKAPFNTCLLPHFPQVFFSMFFNLVKKSPHSCYHIRKLWPCECAGYQHGYYTRQDLETNLFNTQSSCHLLINLQQHHAHLRVCLC